MEFCFLLLVRVSFNDNLLQKRILFARKRKTLNYSVPFRFKEMYNSKIIVL